MEKLVLAFTLLVGTTHGLIGYDCGSQSLNVTTLSLLEVGACEIKPTSINVTRRYLQLLQINDFLETDVFQCKLEVHRTVYHCGMFSHMSIVRHGRREYIYDISRERCMELFYTGIIKITENQVLNNVKINETTVNPVLFAGKVDDEGKCSGTSYADAYGSWDSVIVQGLIRITVQRQKARVDVNNNKIHLRSGTTCILTDTYCIDIENGYTFWDAIPTNRCKFEQYGLLYEGYADKITDSDYNHEQTVYSLSTEDVTFALAVKNRESVCGYTVWRTEHPKLVIFETVTSESFANRDKINVNNLDIFAYVNSKFVYVEKHMKTQLERLYREVLDQRCRLERQTLKNALAIATQAPDQFAYNLMRGPGYMAVTAGEVVHIIKCIPVEVKVQHGENCYAELQVTKDNVTHYLTPRTHILKLKGTRITCNPILPAFYQIDDGWYKIMPRPTEALHPMIVQPMTKPIWKYLSPSYLATSGIYTEKDLEQLRDHIMFPVERPALLNDIAREINGHPIDDKEGTITRLLNEDVMDRITSSAWDKFVSRFMAFGTASAGFLALYLIIITIKTVIEIIINGVILHKAYGWSIHLLGAIWSVVANFLVYLATPRKENPSAKECVPEEEALNKTNAEDSPNSSQPIATTRVNKPDEPGFFSLNP